MVSDLARGRVVLQGGTFYDTQTWVPNRELLRATRRFC
jgi:hypothetical protein